MTTENEPNEQREQTWPAVGALAGVIVGGVLIAVLIVLTSGKSGPPGRPVTSTPGTPGAAAGPPVGTARDDSLRIAEEAGITLNTLDYRTAARTLDAWEALATGPLLDELKAKREETMSSATKAKAASSAKVLAAGVSMVAQDATSADVLVAVQVSTTDQKGSTTRLVRDRLTITQTAQGWKISAVTVVDAGS
jgi:Mce-associated membrane protein